jgi:hypothetical protein
MGMQKQADGKVRRSRKEWEQIFDRFRSSGQSGAAFCRKNKLPKSSFEKWRKKVGRPLVVKKPTPSFVEWPTSTTPEPRSVSSAQLAPGEFELSLPGGVALRWKP